MVQEPFQIPIQLFLHPFYYGDLKWLFFYTKPVTIMICKENVHCVQNNEIIIQKMLLKLINIFYN